jgi:hypothetical protein
LTSLIPGRDGRGHSHRHSNRQVWTLTPIWRRYIYIISFSLIHPKI